MMKLFYLMGKSASGKDTLYRRLLAEEGLQLLPLVPYTTRPKRSEETEGRDYHFTDEVAWKKYMEEGRVIESRTYHTIHGDWHYYTVAEIPKEEAVTSEKNYIAIGTLASYHEILAYYGEEIVCPVYITLDDGERLSRALARERSQKQPRYKELCRRFLADDEDFRDEVLQKLKITRTFENDDLEKAVQEIGAYIETQI